MRLVLRRTPVGAQVPFCFADFFERSVEGHFDGREHQRLHAAADQIVVQLFHLAVVRRIRPVARIDCGNRLGIIGLGGAVFGHAEPEVHLVQRIAVVRKIQNRRAGLINRIGFRDEGDLRQRNSGVAGVASAAVKRLPIQGRPCERAVFFIEVRNRKGEHRFAVYGFLRHFGAAALRLNERQTIRLQTAVGVQRRRIAGESVQNGVSFGLRRNAEDTAERLKLRTADNAALEEHFRAAVPKVFPEHLQKVLTDFVQVILKFKVFFAL